MYCLQSKKGSKRLLILLLLVTVAVLVVLGTGVLDKQIAEYYERFGMAEDTSSLTTGRSDVWWAYMQFFGQNPWSFLFGQGFSSVLWGVPKGSHNSLIQMLYQLGLFGTLLLLSGLFVLFSLFKKTEKNVVRTLLMTVFCFAMWLGLDLLFFDDFFLTIALFTIGLQGRSDENNSVQEETQCQN